MMFQNTNIYSIFTQRRGMADSKTVKELMIDVFEYPHMPYWFTIRQAVGIMKRTVIDVQKCIHPQLILVFDEKYNLIGTLSIRDILRGLVPGLLAPMPAEDAKVTPDEKDALADVEARLYGADTKKLLEKPISEIMQPVRVSVSLEDSVAKAAFLMERRNIQVLPILENNKKLVGIVRIIEVFREVSSILTEK
jgi:CBS domain-containing protein